MCIRSCWIDWTMFQTSRAFIYRVIKVVPAAFMIPAALSTIFRGELTGGIGRGEFSYNPYLNKQLSALSVFSSTEEMMLSTLHFLNISCTVRKTLVISFQILSFPAFPSLKIPGCTPDFESFTVILVLKGCSANWCNRVGYLFLTCLSKTKSKLSLCKDPPKKSQINSLKKGLINWDAFSGKFIFVCENAFL